MKYFLHDSNAFNDEKITELYLKFGYEGLGLFYTILEKLSSQEKPIKTIVLKSQLSVGKKLEKCWLFMEEIQLISSNNGETFNKQLLNFSEKYKIKKQKNTERIAEWRKNQEFKENVTCYESVSNTPKVKESKVKESKVKVYTDNSKILNEFSLSFFDQKYINEKSLQSFDKLLEKYSIENIKISIQKAKSDQFWSANFLSPLKLNSKDKSGVFYIDKFLGLKSNIVLTENKNKKVHYRLFGHETTHVQKAYDENLKLYGEDKVQFLNYVEDGN